MIQICKDIFNIGVNDHTITLFESQFPVPDGMAYNSYIIMDEKIAVTDTVEIHFRDVWLENLEGALGGREPDYLIVHHMEPDHSACIAAFLDRYPSATLVTSAAALTMTRQFFGRDFSGRAKVVKEGDTLPLGRHTLSFITAPMVHWPEVIMSYDSTDGVLFSADAFGTFGANDRPQEKPWAEEARRYYTGIVGKFGVQVQAVLKKAAALDIRTICATHGPALSGDLEQYFALYGKWSSYTPESDDIFIAYTSVYGHTAEAVHQLEEKLKSAGKGCCSLNLAECDMSEAVAQAFRCAKLVLATTTYNMGIFPFMDTFLHKLAERNFCRRTVGLIENGSWAPLAAKVMKEKLSACKEMTILEPTVTIKSALDENSAAKLGQLAGAL